LGPWISAAEIQLIMNDLTQKGSGINKQCAGSEVLRMQERKTVYPCGRMADLLHVNIQAWAPSPFGWMMLSRQGTMECRALSGC